LNFPVLFKKEIKEHIRTYKLLIVVAALLVFGLGTPLLLKFLPEILTASGEQIPVPLPQFGAIDAIQSYLSTLSQIGLLITVLIAMGAVAQERERRTAIMTLSKSAGFGAFITAKLAALVVTFGIGFWLGAAGCYLYTVVLLGNFSALDFVFINLLTGFYLVVCLSVTLMYSTFFRNQLAAGGLALATLIGLVLISNIPVIGKYTPSSLMNQAAQITSGAGIDLWPSLIINLIVCAVIILASILIGWQVLKRQEL
jgi:ABC-2 type transport system permease protein